MSEEVEKQFSPVENKVMAALEDVIDQN
jgi:hypothetical protein